MNKAFSGAQLAVLERQIDEWLGELDAAHDHIVAVDRSPDGDARWFVRMAGDDKDFITVWFSLGQRTLRFETGLMIRDGPDYDPDMQTKLERTFVLPGERLCTNTRVARYLFLCTGRLR